MNITDEELIYNLKCGRREAQELLFFSFEKKMGFIINKNKKLFVSLGMNDDDKRICLYEGINQALNYYQLSNGNFYSFCYSVITREIIDLYRENKSRVEIKEYEVDNVITDNFELEDYLSDSSINIQQSIDCKYVLDLIKEMGMVQYNVINLYLQGYSYDDIAEKLHLSKKKVSNILQAIRKRIKNEIY